MPGKKTKKQKPFRPILGVFWALISVFCFILASFFVPAVREPLMGPWFMLLPGIFFLLGGVLIWLVLRQKIKPPLKKYLLLTGGSAVGFLAFSVLHNLLYAIEIAAKNSPLISGLAGLLHGLFFLVAVIACPIGFIAGAAGSIVKLRKG